MARNISVKVPVAGLIAEIENKIANIEKDIEEYPAKREAYERDLKTYETEVIGFVANFISKNGHLVGDDHDSVIRLSSGHWNNRVELTLDPSAIQGFPSKPDKPEQPNQHSHYGRDYTTQKSLLEKNLKILKMTSQEEVSASTYGAVLELL